MDQKEREQSDAQEWFDLNAEEMTTAEYYFTKFSELSISFSQFLMHCQTIEIRFPTNLTSSSMILLKMQIYLLLKRITEHWKMWRQSQIAQDFQLSPAKEFKTLSLIQRERVQRRALTGR